MGNGTIFRGLSVIFRSDGADKVEKDVVKIDKSLDGLAGQMDKQAKANADFAKSLNDQMKSGGKSIEGLAQSFNRALSPIDAVMSGIGKVSAIAGLSVLAYEGLKIAIERMGRATELSAVAQAQIDAAMERATQTSQAYAQVIDELYRIGSVSTEEIQRRAQAIAEEARTRDNLSAANDRYRRALDQIPVLEAEVARAKRAVAEAELDLRNASRLGVESLEVAAAAVTNANRTLEAYENRLGAARGAMVTAKVQSDLLAGSLNEQREAARAAEVWFGNLAGTIQGYANRYTAAVEAEKALLDARKKAMEDAAKNADAIESGLADRQIALIEDAEQRELAVLNRKYREQKSVLERAGRDTSKLEEIYQAERNKVFFKFSDERIKAEAERAEKIRKITDVQLNYITGVSVRTAFQILDESLSAQTQRVVEEINRQRIARETARAAEMDELQKNAQERAELVAKMEQDATELEAKAKVRRKEEADAYEASNLAKARRDHAELLKRMADRYAEIDKHRKAAIARGDRDAALLDENALVEQESRAKSHIERRKKLLDEAYAKDRAGKAKAFYDEDLDVQLADQAANLRAQAAEMRKSLDSVRGRYTELASDARSTARALEDGTLTIEATEAQIRDAVRETVTDIVDSRSELRKSYDDLRESERQRLEEFLRSDATINEKNWVRVASEKKLQDLLVLARKRAYDEIEDVDAEYQDRRTEALIAAGVMRAEIEGYQSKLSMDRMMRDHRAELEAIEERKRITEEAMRLQGATAEEISTALVIFDLQRTKAISIQRQELDALISQTDFAHNALIGMYEGVSTAYQNFGDTMAGVSSSIAEAVLKQTYTVRQYIKIIAQSIKDESILRAAESAAYAAFSLGRGFLFNDPSAFAAAAEYGVAAAGFSALAGFAAIVEQAGTSAPSKSKKTEDKAKAGSKPTSEQMGTSGAGGGGGNTTIYVNVDGNLLGTVDQLENAILRASRNAMSREDSRGRATSSGNRR